MRNIIFSQRPFDFFSIALSQPEPICRVPDDMKNNRTGRELAREGALFTDVNDPRLYFGSGGKFGQPTGAPYNAEKIGEVEVMGP